MIGSLNGKLLEADPEGELLVEVNGIGYRVSVTAATLAAAGKNAAGKKADGKKDSEIFLWISQTVRDDVPRLFGFASRDERLCFELLQKAQGVGPALALTVLSYLPPDELRQAVLSADPKALTIVPGVGMRTAQRMMIDLKASLAIATTEVPTSVKGEKVSALAEVREGLAAMGFSAQEIKDALSRLPDAAAAGTGSTDDASTDGTSTDASELMRLALQAINQKT